MRSLRRPRNLVLLALLVLACTGGTFSCNSGDDDGDKVTVNGSVNN